MKSLGFIPRRTDFTRVAFRRHYEAQHASLALRDCDMMRKHSDV